MLVLYGCQLTKSLTEVSVEHTESKHMEPQPEGGEFLRGFGVGSRVWGFECREGFSGPLLQEDPAQRILGEAWHLFPNASRDIFYCVLKGPRALPIGQFLFMVHI